MGETVKRSWRVTPKAGSFDNLQYVEGPLDMPSKNEVQVDVKSVGLNFADIFAIFGLYSATPPGEFTPGLEFSGVITEVGEDVTGYAKGDRVMGVSRFGAYTSSIVSHTDYIAKLPEPWSFNQGAAYLVQVLTAYYGLIELGNIQKESTVLIHSAAGGVGIWANRIAKQFDAYTIGTVGNNKKLDVLKEEGYDRGIVRGEDFPEKLREAIGDRELKIVMECIGGDILMESYKQMAMEGRLITYGSARYAHPGAKPNKLKLLLKYLKRPKLDPQMMVEQNKGILGFNLIYLFTHSEKMEQYLGKLSQMDLGDPVVGHTFPFTEVRKALDLFLSGKTTGKVVLEV